MLAWFLIGMDACGLRAEWFVAWDVEFDVFDIFAHVRFELRSFDVGD